MIKQSSQGINEGVNIITITKGIILSYIVTIPLFLIFAFILSHTNFPEKYVTTVVIIVTIISILIASSTVTKNAKNKGWLNGTIVGFTYMLALYVISSLVLDNFQINRYIITMTVIGVLTGAIGGIIGINIKAASGSRSKSRRT
jgi:putative membrane protein (TIGR04086 family)